MSIRSGKSAFRPNQSVTSQVARQIEIAREEERAHIAREIHDELGSNLTAIKMALAVLTRALPPEPTIIDKATYLNSLVDRTIEAMHKLATDMRPAVLDLGLVAALEWQAVEFQKQTGIDCTVESQDQAVAISPELATALFRIAQESLTNISKHAQASKVTIAFAVTPRSIRLSVSDNGCGIDPVLQKDYPLSSHGIRNMQERACMIDGILTIGNCAGGGTTVSIKVPRLTQ